MKTPLAYLATILFAVSAHAATAVKVTFTLNTSNKSGAAIQQNRYYYLYRPDGYPTTTPLPAILVMETTPGAAAISVFNTKAAQAGFVVITCSISGNSTGTPGTVWVADDPRWAGNEDYDYTSEVINRVRASDNCNDFFICGLSKGGHMAYAFACERPSQIKAASSIDELMQLGSNIPSARVPIISLQGTGDTTVAFFLSRDSIDAWRAMNGVLSATPVITYESSPLAPGSATQATWRGANGAQVAWVVLVGGTHSFPTPTTVTGYNIADGLWSFFSQYLTPLATAVKIVSQPVNNTQIAGQPASFWVAATGAAPITYQWQKNGVDIVGATSNWFTTPPAALADNGAQYRAVVTNGSASVFSNTATLTVNAAPAGPGITTQPVNVTVSAGQSFTFSIAASGTGTLTYQWQKEGMAIVGATAASFTGNAITPDSGATFRVLVTDSTGTTKSCRATLTVLPATGAPIILANPERIRALSTQTGTFSVSVWSASPMTYQWQKSTAINANLIDIPGATGATYTPPIPGAAVTQPHRCIVTNAVGNATSACDFFLTATTASGPGQIASLPTAVAQVGVPFSYTIASSGGTQPFTYAASPLPAGLSINTSTGVISGTPQSAGTSSITISCTNSAATASGTLTLTTTVTPTAIPFSAWRAAKFGASSLDDTLSGPLAIPDAGGLANLMRYATGKDPFTTSALSFGPALENGFLTQTATKGANATGLTWSAESSNDLLNWSSANISVLQDSATIFQARDNNLPGATPRRFMRLKVTLGP